MRTSVAAAAVVRRPGGGGGSQFLANWNPKWHALHLVGEHKEPGESFADCAARELAEETGLLTGR